MILPECLSIADYSYNFTCRVVEDWRVEGLLPIRAATNPQKIRPAQQHIPRCPNQRTRGTFYTMRLFVRILNKRERHVPA